MTTCCEASNTFHESIIGEKLNENLIEILRNTVEVALLRG